ncbi:MAG TPA: glycosyltransferase family 4 protein [Tepidisphaeraceae bacterium]|nr:glycosyltransferase family 4 protein [Tepidisphaeraceae bacterium]
MRRILLLITDLEIGGSPTVVRELAIRLHRLPNVHVEVACLSPWGPVADQLVAADVTVTAFDAQGANDLAAIGRLVELIHHREFDTVFSFLIHANAAAAMASLVCRRVRFIQSIQTTQPNPRWHWILQRRVQKRAARIVVPSESTADVAHEWARVPREKIVVIHNAIEPKDFPPTSVTGTPTPFPIGFIGRLDPIKSIPDLLQATLLLGGSVHLHIFGEGRERVSLMEEILRLKLTPGITLHGAIARPQEALSRIGLLVLPSKAEGFGLVLIEAMTARVPIVATDVPGIRNVVTNEKTGLLVPHGAPRELALAIDRLVRDLALRERLVDAAEKHVREHFTWDIIFNQYRALLEV